MSRFTYYICGPKEGRLGLVVGVHTAVIYVRSPRIRRAIIPKNPPFGMMVTRLAWIAHKLVSSKSPTRYASEASCKARTALD
uniref:Uncharacterized protein n=1 Tax=Meloidogyne incognita TaxID=6306 RepID=A0A914LRP0_MELIC